MSGRIWLQLGFLMTAMQDGCGGRATWTAGAEDARFLAPGQLDRARAAVAALPESPRSTVEATLVRVSQTPATVEGLVDATGAVRAAMPGLGDPQSDSSGLDPAQRALRDAAACLFHGLAARAGGQIATTRDAARAQALIEAIEAIDVLGPAAPSRLVEEARVGLGDELYLAARQRAAPTP